jgi:hypothetical protein
MVKVWLVIRLLWAVTGVGERRKRAEREMKARAVESRANTPRGRDERDMVCPLVETQNKG